MRALCLHQPWATLVALGYKHVETRSWTTAYRGDLMIHAAARKRALPDASLVMTATLRSIGYDFPLGAFVARCRLVDVVPTEEFDPSTHDALLGDFSTGRFAWVLDDISELTIPVPARGQQGLWTPTDVGVGVGRDGCRA